MGLETSAARVRLSCSGWARKKIAKHAMNPAASTTGSSVARSTGTHETSAGADVVVGPDVVVVVDESLAAGDVGGAAAAAAAHRGTDAT